MRMILASLDSGLSVGYVLDASGKLPDTHKHPIDPEFTCGVDRQIYTDDDIEVRLFYRLGVSI